MTIWRPVMLTLAIAAVGVVASGTVSAKAMLIPLDQKVAESDFIGIVRIIEIQPLSQPTHADSRWPYRQLARAEVVESLKGPQPGTVIELEFDNGLVCPNATYDAATEYLVFWRRISSQRYETYNFYHGVFRVEEGQIAGWNDSGDNPPEHSTVVAEIEELLGQ